MVKVELDKSIIRNPELQYILTVWAKNANVDLVTSEGKENVPDLNKGFRDLVDNSLLLRNDITLPLPDSTGLIRYPGNTPDYLSTAFYLINSLQEHDPTKRDDLGRFPYHLSYQATTGNVQSNIVQKCFDEISSVVGIPLRNKPSEFFLTHDIDLVYGAIIEDGFNVIRKGQFHFFFKMLFNLALGKPDWLNIDQIMKIESEYDCRSVFYWIVNKGKLNSRERNADYNFRSESIQKYFKQVENSGFENGIHKSISPETFKQEIVKYGSLPEGNRYHYLKFSLPQAYHDIEDAGLKLDASLGFAEEIGFRNSYGLPFNPYNFSSRRPFGFIEVPLNIMDRTFFQYKRVTPGQAEQEILDFFEKNKRNAVLSVLWHNNFFTDYKFKGYLQLYKNILSYLKVSQFKTVTQKELIANYSIH